jgi:hypothetical protein
VIHDIAGQITVARKKKKIGWGKEMNGLHI